MKNGPYELVKAPRNYPGKLYRDKYCYEHRLVWWKNTGNLPYNNQVIHHKNENKRDNRFENLECLDKEDHCSHHGRQQLCTYVKLVCPACGDEFIRKKRKTHLVKPNKATYCSRSCIGKMTSNNRDYNQFDQVISIWKE